MSSLRDERRDLQKQIGCMNVIFQFFDRHHFLAGRRSGGNGIAGHRRLLQDTQHQRDSRYQKAIIAEKGQEKPRTSTESSRASYSSSTCSTSTFSSVEWSRTGTASQPEPIQLRPISIPESKPHVSATKEQQQQQPSSAKRVAKDSVSREVRAPASNERRGSPMKHIDSPRPSVQLYYDVKKRQFTDDQLALPRFSYDGRESRMRQKEHPRLSLDSKTSSMKFSALESRSNFLVGEQNVSNQNSQEILPSDQEPGSHHRSSSIVAKLMGLEAFPDTMALSESHTPTLKSSHEEDFCSQLASTADHSKPNQASPRLLDRNSVWKSNTCSRLPAESAPWRQQDCSQGSPRTFLHNRKPATNAPRLSSSIYGEMEKRIVELEFKKSGKDHRALKQILDAMEKTRERLENQRGESTEARMQRYNHSYSNQSSNLSMPDDQKSYHQVPANGSSTRRQLGSPVGVMKPVQVMDKVTAKMSQLHRVRTQDPKYHQENTNGRQKDKDLSPKSKLRDRSPGKKTTWRTSEMDRSLARPQGIKVEDCTSPRKGSGMTSPRLQHSPLRLGLLSHSAAPLSDTKEIKKYCSKSVKEKGSSNRKNRLKAKDIQMSDDQLSELSGETRHLSYQGDTASVKSESNNSLVSQTDIEMMSQAHTTNIKARHKENAMSRTRKHIKAVESVLTMAEQPSPISVLDDSFYCEGSPSPVKKTSTAFQDDILGSGEEEWNLENPKHVSEYRRLDHRCKHNQKSERLKHTTQELSFLPNEIAENHSELLYESHNQDHRYITKILLISGLLKSPNFISATDQLLPSCHLINPDIFHVIEQTEEEMEDSNGRFLGKNDKMKLDKKIWRRIIFDMVDEILVGKINSGRFAVGKKMANPQSLLKEIYSEMDLSCQISNCNLENAEDEIVKLLTVDLKHWSEDWASYNGEVPALVLDIERQIFKDLINEVVTGEVIQLGNQTNKPRRQLFRH